jgi:Na+/H+ antiporter NhaD/arsenite permease-like protein
MLPLAVAVLLAVFALVAVRQVGGVRLHIWQVMAGGALVVLAFGQISPPDALAAIDLDVMLFLFGMFVVGSALDESGYLEHLAYKMFRRAGSPAALVLVLVFGVGMISALLMNDTLAIVGTPAVLVMARRHRLSPKLMLLGLAFAVTIGSVFSPIGNPQNLLVAVDGGIHNPFLAFAGRLLLPTLVNLLAAYCLLRLFYRSEFRDELLVHEDAPLRDPALARLAKLSLWLVLVLVVLKVALTQVDLGSEFRLTYIALAAAAPILLFSPKRAAVLHGVDWTTLAFFVAMFVLMAVVWATGFFQAAIAGLDITGLALIIVLSVLLSQLISNVPLVALFLPLLLAAGVGEGEMLALAAGSTVAGNLTVLGAASNVIIIQAAERHGETLSFWEFARVGVPLTLINMVVYWLFLTL